MAKHDDEAYIQADPFEGDEADLTCRSVMIRTARKAHACYGLMGERDHHIGPGQKYRYERARVDGSFWGEYKMCLSCMDRFMGEGEDEDEEND